MREIPHSPVALYEAANLFGTLVAKTILASVHVRARKKAGHMGASDLINAAAKYLARSGPSTYGESGLECDNAQSGTSFRLRLRRSAPLIIPSARKRKLP